MIKKFPALQSAKEESKAAGGLWGPDEPDLSVSADVLLAIAAILQPLASTPVDPEAIAIELGTILRKWAKFRAFALMREADAARLKVVAAAANPARKAMKGVAAIDWFEVAELLREDWSSANDMTREMVGALDAIWGPGGQRRLAMILGGIAAVADRAATKKPRNLPALPGRTVPPERPDLHALGEGLAMLLWNHTRARPTTGPVWAMINALIAGGTIPANEVYRDPIRKAVELSQDRVDASLGKADAIWSGESFPQ
jgi:hypothetical protein